MSPARGYSSKSVFPAKSPSLFGDFTKTGIPEQRCLINLKAVPPVICFL